MAYKTPDNLTLIATRTASTSASLEFTSVLSTNWSTYYVSIRNLVPASNTVDLNITFSNDNGSTYLSTNYKYAYLNQMTSGTLVALGSNSSSACQIATNISNASATSLDADIYFYNLNTTTYPSYYKGRLTHYQTDGSGNYNSPVGGMNTDLTGIDAMKFAYSTGNITSGTIYLYGVNEP